MLRGEKAESVGGEEILMSGQGRGERGEHDVRISGVRGTQVFWKVLREVGEMTERVSRRKLLEFDPVLVL